DRDIPLDVLVIDTDWRLSGSSGYKPNPKDFPNLKRFFREAHQLHAHVMFNDHPEPHGPAPLSPEAIDFRYNHLSKILDQGLDIWWYDRNWRTSLRDITLNHHTLRHETWGMKLYHDITLNTRPHRRPWIMSN